MAMNILIMNFYSLMYLLLSLTITQVHASAPGPNEATSSNVDMNELDEPYKPLCRPAYDDYFIEHFPQPTPSLDWTPLHIAACSTHDSSVATVKELLASEANPKAQCKKRVLSIVSCEAGCIGFDNIRIAPARTEAEEQKDHYKYRLYTPLQIAQNQLHRFQEIAQEKQASTAQRPIHPKIIPLFEAKIALLQEAERKVITSQTLTDAKTHLKNVVKD